MCGLEAHDEANVIVAPKLEREPDDVIHALLRHELAHGILLFCGHDDHSERDADALAEAIWGDRLNYDHRDVQTLAPGRHPRPEHLHR
jgi:predicted SprT family Zn-dependent metalloprotease